MHKSIRVKLHSLLILLLALVCLCACGLTKEDPLAIKSFAIGDCQGTVETVTENGQTRYVINISLPDDIDFKHCAANIELQPGAEISTDSPCLVDYLGGRPVLNLTLEDRDLIVVNASNKRNYSFHIELLK